VKIIEDVVAGIIRTDKNVMAQAQKQLDSLTKPKRSLGKLEDFAKRITGITGSLKPPLKNKSIFTMAGDHGVAEEGISLFPKEVTEQMVYNLLAGGAGVNVLAEHIGARIVIVDMGVATKIEHHGDKNFIDKKVNYGTKNMAKEPAMSRKEALRSIAAGIEVFREQKKERKVDIIGIGDMGIGNTTSSSAITSCITGADVSAVTGRGTGIDDEHLKIKIKTINKALQVNKPDPKDPVDVLAKVGGFEIGGLAGLILAAACDKVPVVIDGFITASAALVATGISPLSKEYIFASHNSVERGHEIALNWMELEPMFDLKMRLGEGTGACLGINLIEAGVRILTEMATFEDAGVSRGK
jgi:nicotinate-nucleotide--dimethylbenzimidazole phosphoribosyltransferase